MKQLNGEYIRGDWRDVLPALPDNYFAVTIADPPFFTGPDKRGYYGRSLSSATVKRRTYELMDWSEEIPGMDYYEEICRVSRNQIIWGVNYFPFAGCVPGRVIWDKCNQSSSFSDCEIASSSFHDSTRMFRYMWNGMMQGKSIKEGWIQQGNKKKNEKRIHPTQKPVNLYKWLTMKYTNPGDKVLDTHVGSASSLIAYEAAGLQYMGIEKDAPMYGKSLARLSAYVKSQSATLFNH